MTTPSPPTASAWVSFDDEAGETWLFELPFFASNWNCIYGSGCAGIEEVPDQAGHRGCCSYGAHFADDDDLGRVMRIAAALPPDVWQHHAQRPDGSSVAELIEALTRVDDDGDRITSVVDGACVFLNRPDFAGGQGCALHVAAVNAEIDPLHWKPEVCWQLPIRVEHHVDDNDHTTHFVRQWLRRDWGDAGDDLGWWCAEAEEAYSGVSTVARYLRGEIAELSGEAIADALIDHVDHVMADRPGTAVFLPMPVRR